MSIEQRLKELGPELPTVPSPAAIYVNAVRTGNLVFTSGTVPTTAGGDIPKLEAAAPGGTIPNVGQSAGSVVQLASGVLRFKSLSVHGHTNFAVPPDELGAQYRRRVGHALTGEIRLDVERVPLDSIADAWRRQSVSPGTKLVVVP